jgi:hypothetical protein
MICIDTLLSQYLVADECLPAAVQETVAQVKKDWSLGNYLAVFAGISALRRFSEARPKANPG